MTNTSQLTNKKHNNNSKKKYDKNIPSLLDIKTRKVSELVINHKKGIIDKENNDIFKKIIEEGENPEKLDNELIKILIKNGKGIDYNKPPKDITKDMLVKSMKCEDLEFSLPEISIEKLWKSYCVTVFNKNKFGIYNNKDIVGIK
jgi:hypothetical protein